jgi:DNA polymerase-1
MPTLYLIDGYAQFFRAFHAIRTPMSSPVTKEPTNMTFGFVGMLLKLLRGEGAHMNAADGRGRATHVAVAIDVSGDRETFRSELYPEYKAHRPEIPELLPPQIDRALSLLREIGVPVVGIEGFEADDTIATLVTTLREAHPDLRIRIISKDKDLKQLLANESVIDGRSLGAVEMYDIHTDVLTTVESLKADTGLEPKQIIDMLALMGDSVDNVPGVEGVGEKTAAQLIAQYGSLDRLLASASEIKGKRGEKIREAASLLDLSRKLVALRHDAPVTLDLESAEVKGFKLDRLIAICRELGFNRYQDEVRALLGASVGTESPRLMLEPTSQQWVPPGGASAKKSASKANARREAGGLFEGSLFAREAPGRALGPVDGDYEAVLTREHLDRVIAELRAAPIISIDTETTSLVPRQAKLCGISLSIAEGRAWYIPMRSPSPEKHLDEATVLGGLRAILEDPTRAKCGHNLKFDLLVLRNAGIELRGLVAHAHAERADWPAGDTMVASYLIDSSRSSHSKDALCLALLGRTNIPISDLIGSGRNQRSFESVPLDQAVPYAAEDADVTMRLRDIMLPQLRAMGLMDLWLDVELPLVEVLAELEWNGIAVDAKELDRQRDRLIARIAELKLKIDDEAMSRLGRTFNPDSPKQLAAALFNKPGDMEPGLGLKSVKKTKTGHSTDIEVLEKLAGDPALSAPEGGGPPVTIPALIVEHRQLSKLVGTYLEALKQAIDPGTRRVHASFNQTVAATGRLSSSDPNLQNIPIRTDVGREIRRAFVAPTGRVLVSADYSQIELRILAHLSRDPALIDAFHKDQDIHTAVAAQIHGVPPEEVTREQRSGAKMVNFGIVYGITAYGLARRLQIGEREAADIIAGYKQRFSGISTFLEECIAQAKRYGYVETMLKRRRLIPGIDARNPNERALAERVAINSVVQGSAADLIKIAMVDLHRRLSEHAGDWRAGKPPEIDGVRMLLQIHDELVFEADEGMAEAARSLVVQRMEGAMTLGVPLKVDSSIASNWFDGK